MIEKALTGGKRYWVWMAILLAIIGAGTVCYLQQLKYGLGITGLSRDVTWGFYIAQFTFLVGVAASAVMVALPCYLHDYRQFDRITVIAEFLAVSAVTMCLLFIIVDLGQPARALNIILHPTPNSILFWDMIVLSGYLLLNIIIGWSTLEAKRISQPPPSWTKPLIYLSIPWAISIHTVTAFIYCGLPGRSFWLTAILAPRFLASAFASGPSLLVIVCLIIRKYARFDPGKEAIQKLAQIILYAMIVSVFFLSLELFTAFYSQIPEHTLHFKYLFTGMEGKALLVPWMWCSVLLAAVSIVLLIIPATRRNEALLLAACVAVFISIWLEKGIGMITGGFVPSPLGEITEYAPTPREVLITLGVWALGLLILTALCRVATFWLTRCGIEGSLQGEEWRQPDFPATFGGRHGR